MDCKNRRSKLVRKKSLLSPGRFVLSCWIHMCELSYSFVCSSSARYKKQGKRFSALLAFFGLKKRPSENTTHAQAAAFQSWTRLVHVTMMSCINAIDWIARKNCLYEGRAFQAKI